MIFFFITKSILFFLVRRKKGKKNGNEPENCLPTFEDQQSRCEVIVVIEENSQLNK